MSSSFLYTSGPRDSKVILVGEAWGEEESRVKTPFAGFSGKELDRILFDSGLSRSDILCTNLVDKRPEGNDFTQFLEKAGNKTSNIFRGTGATTALIEGHKKLSSLIATAKPKLIIGAGNWPLWALTKHAKLTTKLGYKVPTGIMNWRGSQTYTEEIEGVKYPYLPIIHPAAITRDWSLRHITCQDLRARGARFLAGTTSWEGTITTRIGRGRLRIHQP